MSGADFEAMDNYNRGLYRVPDTKVCYRHINDLAVKKFIKLKSKPGTCYYCGRKSTKVVGLETLMRFLMEAVAHFYKDPAEFMRPLHGGGWDGYTYDGWEVLNDCFVLPVDELLFEDIRLSIETDKAWGDEADYFGDEADFLKYHWDYFVRVVKHRARYLFGNTNDLRSTTYNLKPYDILKNIGEKVNRYGLVKTMEPGSILYRCRQHPRIEHLKTGQALTSPPTELANQPNRMSPAGISMFYGAFSRETSLAETLDYSRKLDTHCTSGVFQTRETLTVIDLSAIPPIPSVFDQAKWDDLLPIRFLGDFVDDLVKPISRDAKVHIEYVPTQIVTEYFRYAFKGSKKKKIKVDGIIYPSSRIPGENACVLFFDHEESLEQLIFLPAELVRKKVIFPTKPV